MKILASGLALALLATPAMAQSIGEKTSVNSTLGITPTTEDFVKEAAISDMFEIQSSQMPQERGNAPGKTFAATMVNDHQKTTDELKSMVSSGEVKVQLPSALDSSKTTRDRQAEIAQRPSLRWAKFSQSALAGSKCRFSRA